MTLSAGILLAVLSVWDYPARQPRHNELRRDFVRATASLDAEAAYTAAKAGTELLPDDPTWRYNLACSEAKLGRETSAMDDLEKAIRLGFRDPGMIEADADFAKFVGTRRFKDAIELAERLQNERVLFGPLAVVPAKAQTGGLVSLGAQNMAWNFDAGCFSALLELSPGEAGGNAGDLYFNRDGGHSDLVVTNFPGLTRVMLDSVGRERGMDLDFPNTIFPCPVFGNCSRAMTKGPLWRSMPRALLTMESGRLPLMYTLYRSNQVWVYPAVHDTPPMGPYGDLFSSVAPYWIVTEGRSWSDKYYLKAALAASAAMNRKAKREAVARGDFAALVQTLLRKSLKGVLTEDDYLTPKAHPTAFPPNGIDFERLKASASALTMSTLPPVAVISGVAASKTEYAGKMPEITHASPCAWGFVLRGPETNRSFVVRASGGAQYAFAQVHGAPGAAVVERLSADSAKITVDRTLLSPTNRADVAIVAKGRKSGWGAPAYVSFAVVDEKAAYFDPVLAGVPPPEGMIGPEEQAEIERRRNAEAKSAKPDAGVR